MHPVFHIACACEESPDFKRALGSVSCTHYALTVGTSQINVTQTDAVINIPKEYNDAVICEHGVQWEGTMGKELTSYQDHHVYDLVPISSLPSTFKPTGLRSLQG